MIEIDMQTKKKEQKFKGKTLEELRTLDVREFAELVGAGSKRAILRNFQEHENFITLAKAKLKKGKKSIRTHKRSLVIVPELVDMRIQIYNGREFTPLDITMDMLGHKFGEFSPTRVRTKHTSKDKKKK